MKYLYKKNFCTYNTPYIKYRVKDKIYEIFITTRRLFINNKD